MTTTAYLYVHSMPSVGHEGAVGAGVTYVYPVPPISAPVVVVPPISAPVVPVPPISAPVVPVPAYPPVAVAPVPVTVGSVPVL